MVEKLGGEKLGDLLVKAGLIDEHQLQSALGHQRRWGHKLGKCLIDLGFIEEAELLKFLSDRFKIKAVDLTKSVITEQTFAVVQEAIAKKYGVVPVFIKEGPGNKKTIILAMSDPTDLKVVDEIQFLTGHRVEPVLATESAIAKVLENYGKTYKPEPEKKRDVARPVDLRKEHQKQAEKSKEAESVEVGDAEILLGGEDVEEILDLKEVEQEGIEITPDDGIQVIKDEVVMVKTDKPRPKGTKVGSSTERIPMRPRIRDEIKPAGARIEHPPQPTSLKTEPTVKPSPQPEPTPELSLTPPEINMGAEPESSQAESMVPAPEPSTPPTESATPVQAIEIPEPSGEEKIELAAAHEFISWEAQETPKLETEPEKPSVPDVQELTEPVPAPKAQTEIQLSQPEALSDDDFWADVQKPASVSRPKSVDLEAEDRLPFEMPIKAPEPAQTSQQKQEFLGSIEELTGAEAGKESELYSGEPAREALAYEEPVLKSGDEEEPGEVSLEFALRTIKELKEEVKQRELQMDELLNLMMKKEIGEITTEIYMRELGALKAQIEKLRNKKT